MSLRTNRWRFERHSRLVKSSEFQRVFNEKTCQSSGGGLSVIARHNELGFPRLGLVVSSRVAKRAVARNRIKRIIRESFRTRQGEMAAYDIVVIARPGVERRTNPELFANLEGHWKKLEQCAKSSSI